MVRTSVCVKRRLCPVSQKVNFELGKEKEIYERVRMDADKSQTSREAREWTQFMSGEMQRETRVTLLLLLLLLKTQILLYKNNLFIAASCSLTHLFYPVPERYLLDQNRHVGLSPSLASNGQTRDCIRHL